MHISPYVAMTLSAFAKVEIWSYSNCTQIYVEFYNVSLIHNRYIDINLREKNLVKGYHFLEILGIKNGNLLNLSFLDFVIFLGAHADL